MIHICGRLTFLQINLFKNDTISSLYNKHGNQIFTRKFKLNGSLDVLNSMDYTNEEFLQFRKDVFELKDSKREKIQVANLTADSLAKLELLGIAEFDKRYMVTIDFSNILDLALSELLQSEDTLKAVRSMENYDEISYAFINCDFNKINDIPLSRLFGVDDRLDQLLLESITKYANECKNLKLEMQGMQVLDDFYSKITAKLTTIENYTTTALQFLYPSSDAVYRSKLFSTTISTSNIKIEDELILTGDFGKASAIIKSYEPYEYARYLGEQNVINL